MREVPVPVVPIWGVIPLFAPDILQAIEADRVLADDVKVGSDGTPAPEYHQIFSPFPPTISSSRISVQPVRAFIVA